MNKIIYLVKFFLAAQPELIASKICAIIPKVCKINQQFLSFHLVFLFEKNTTDSIHSQILTYSVPFIWCP